MMRQQAHPLQAAAVPALHDIEFLTIELAALADGRIHVSITATTIDDQEPQLLNQEITRDRLPTIEVALERIGQLLRTNTK